MTYVGSRSDKGEEAGYVVQPPRVTDAIGAALRASYGTAGCLPAEWRRCLDLLDRHR